MYANSLATSHTSYPLTLATDSTRPNVKLAYTPAPESKPTVK